MVSWSGHILPMIVTVVIWFFATGLIAWLDNRDRSTFPRSLMLGGAAGLAGLVIILVAMGSTSSLAIYAAFVGALLVWSWHEIAFLTGATAGPRRAPCPDNASGWERFSQASATVMHHEIALVLTALMLITLTWFADNQIGAMTFVLLYVLRLSTKLNIFLGVPNSHTDILPPHLAYLKTYYGPNRLTALLPATIVGLSVLAWAIGQAAVSAPAGSAEAIGASLLFALAALGVLEHLFLALPFKDRVVWGWALPRSENTPQREPAVSDTITVKSRGDLGMEEEG